MTAAFATHAANPARRAAAGGYSPPGTLVGILARNPTLFAAWSGMSTALKETRLPVREKELAVLRVAWRCRAPYEWGKHARRALAAGMSRDEIDRVTRGPADGGWAPFDRAILRAVDELHDCASVSDGTWAALAVRYDEAQLIEFAIVVGFYHLMAFILNALAVPVEEGYEGLPP
jgi:alkylhydroperoxidase family enzyme